MLIGTKMEVLSSQETITCLKEYKHRLRHCLPNMEVQYQWVSIVHAHNDTELINWNLSREEEGVGWGGGNTCSLPVQQIENLHRRLHDSERQDCMSGKE